MKTQSLLMMVIWGCLFAGYAGAQTSRQPQNPRADWRVVEQLSAGTAISVKGQGWHRFRCKVTEVEEQTLECQAETLPGPNLFEPPVFHFRRSEIRQIRLEHPDGTAAVAGIAVGTAGAVVGARGPGGPNPLGAMLLGGLGGLIAAGIGHTFPIHGDVIYQP